MTGGAGFIGSHLVDALVARGDRVRVLDDLFSGSRANVPAGAQLVEGSVADSDTVTAAVAGCEVVFHLAAHGAVARSLANPLASNEANVHGTLAVLTASRDAGVRRVVYASSSSVYGGATTVPTPEDAQLRPRSPYAVSKLAGEWYTRVYGELFALETVSLRYFNVFGPRQRPDSTYAAVIPLFTRAVLRSEAPTVHGDGTQSRDFTYVADVVAANLCAATAPASACNARAYNIAPGSNHTLLELLDALATVTGNRPAPAFTEPRAGDVHRSQADATAARRDLAWSAQWTLLDGLRTTVDWMRDRA